MRGRWKRPTQEQIEEFGLPVQEDGRVDLLARDETIQEYFWARAKEGWIWFLTLVMMVWYVPKIIYLVLRHPEAFEDEHD